MRDKNMTADNSQYSPYRIGGGYQPKSSPNWAVLKPPSTGSNIMTTKPSKTAISVDCIESILMDHGSYEHSIDRLVGELIMSDDEIRSAAQAIYDYVTKNI